MRLTLVRAIAACLIVLSGLVTLLVREPRAAALGQPAGIPASATQMVGRMTLEEKASQLRHDSPAIPRLGIPAYNWWSEGLHGVARAGNATVFPQAIALAATWDAPLIGRTADVIGTEFRAKYAATRAADGGSAGYRGLTVWSPNVNIFRDPRWGRGQETYGEDPYLTSRMAVAFIRGLQGDDPRYFKTIAVVKHFAVHSGPESARHRENVFPTAHDLEDTYLPAFRAAIVEAKAQGVMCAYNAVDGTPACASPLLASRIRDAWGFSGHIVSDCGAIADFFMAGAHRYSATPEQAVAAALNAGTDLICGQFSLGEREDPQVIVRAVRSGLVSEAVVDRAVARLIAARIRLGLLDPPSTPPFSGIGKDQFDTPEHRRLAADAARASLVLLKNDGLLPLAKAPARIAVIGPNADSVDALVGNYNGTPSRPVTVLAGLRQRFPDSRITYVPGTGLVGAPLEPVPDAALCADQACTRPGVATASFADPALKGVATPGTASSIAINWGRPVRGDRNSSMRWTGFITAAETGRYRLKLSGENGYRIIIDGKPLVDAWNAVDPGRVPDGEVALTAGERHSILVEAQQRGDRGEQRLLWATPGNREDAAIKAAADVDLVVFVGGLSAKLEGEEMRVDAPGFAGGDRTSLDLPAPQQALLERLAGLGKPVVLVLMNGSALSINWADRHVPAIIEAWYPGGEGGRAVADLIAGDFSPSGRLPVTFYRAAGQLPPFEDYRMAGRTYRYFTGPVLYPFGYGLSYTRFAYGTPTLDRTRMQPGQPVVVSVAVTNVGNRDGDEVAQLYTTIARAGAPIRSLQGFQRLTLKRGETRVVRFTLDDRALSVVDRQGHRALVPGLVRLWVGGGQSRSPGSAGAEAALHITGSRQLPL
jgi:beta-glucosidase